MNKSTKELLISNKYYMGLHIYDDFYKVVYLDGGSSIVVITDEEIDGFFINDIFVHCPIYAIRLVLSFMILLECKKSDYDINLFCIIKGDDELLDNVDILNSIKEIKGANLEQEAKLVKLFSIAYKEKFANPQYFTVAQTCDVLEGYSLLTQLYFEGDEQ